MAVLITGVAGFIGSNLAQNFLRKGFRVLGIDNLSRGSLSNLEQSTKNPNFTFVKTDLTDFNSFLVAVEKYQEIEVINEVWHLAANSDIPAGVSDASVDLKNTFMTTFQTLQVMKTLNIPVIAFASSSAIYGDHGSRPLVENIGPLLPISNYGAMKLASEAIISAATESFLKQAFIFRFPNVIGIPATHGVIFDFINKLKITPEKLDVLGNGTQQKGYLHVEDLIDAMTFIKEKSHERVAIFNIGANDAGVTVRFIAEETVKVVSPKAQIFYGKTDRGWVGDIPKFIYCTDKLKNLGWYPKIGSAEAIKTAVKQVAIQEHIS